MTDTDTGGAQNGGMDIQPHEGDLAVEDDDAQILGSDAYSLARTVYDAMAPGEVA